MRDGGGELSGEQLDRLPRYFDEVVIAAKNYRHATDNIPRHPVQGRGTWMLSHRSVSRRIKGSTSDKAEPTRELAFAQHLQGLVLLLPGYPDHHLTRLCGGRLGDSLETSS
jgi:hypothetical protein